MNDYNNLPTEEEYRKAIKVAAWSDEYSEPKYRCHKCDGGMCKNLTIVLASIPPRYQYKCNQCGHVDYLFG